MYDANRVVRRLRLYIVRYDYDICLRTFRSILTLTKSKNWSQNDDNVE